MHPLITKLLAKRNIRALEELDKDEKQTFDEWDRILSKEELTIEDVKHFCQSQVEIIEGKWNDYNLENSKKAELIPYHSVYRTLLRVIESPKVAREALEIQLTQLIK